MKKAIAKFILYRLMGWKLNGQLPDLKKYIVIGGPHTSNWDFVLAICFVWILQVKVTILGKKELFVFPFSTIFRSLGVIPVERKKSQNQVEAVAEMFNNREQFIIGLSPEGTRKKVTKLRSGFYNIALKANVPIVVGIIDGATKTIHIRPPYYNTGNKTIDLEYYNSQYKSYKGIIPENSF